MSQPLIGKQSDQDPATHFFRGNQCHSQNDPAGAAACYRKAIELNPDFWEAFYNLGIAYQELDKRDQALAAYQRALELDPNNINVINNLGIILQESGNQSKAIQCFEQALLLNSESVKTYYNLARLYVAQGQLTAASQCYQKAINIQPDYAKAHNALGILMQEQDRLTGSIACFRAALRIKPDYPSACFNLGSTYQKLGNFDQALGCYAEALKINPNFTFALWHCLLALPTVYEKPDDIPIFRQKFSQGLECLIHRFDLNNPDQKKAALAGIGCMTNFYLQYQGLDDLDLQRKYGQFVCNVMKANFPQWTQTKKTPSLQPGERIRLGYVSSYMVSHTVGKLLLGWVENANQNDFEIYCYHINKTTDQLTERFRQHSDHFYHINGDIEAAARQIESDDLHILVFSDIGMYPPATQLAGLRLAPVQCKSWGHPVTTGLPTMDYYLSSDLMEPENAQNFYSEKLIRLPNLALAYEKPKHPLKPKNRDDFGLERSAFIYLCPQSLSKYLPQHDSIFPRIARLVPAASFVFIANAGAAVVSKFKDRLMKSFKEHGLKFENHCRFLPRLYHDDFMSLNLVADVLLDTLCWSGGHTTLEGISCHLPVVTLPGEFMRGRHAYAMLKMIGITETIAANEEDYIAIAARLGSDRSWYMKIKQRMQNADHKLYNDVTCIRYLEDFFRSLVKSPAI